MPEPIDWDQFDAVMGDGSDGMSELFDDFLVDTREKFGSLQTNAQAGNLGAVAWDAHQMKGSASSFGLVTFVEEVGALEAQARAGDHSHLERSIVRLRVLFDEGIAILQAERPFLPK